MKNFGFICLRAKLQLGKDLHKKKNYRSSFLSPYHSTLISFLLLLILKIDCKKIQSNNIRQNIRFFAASTTSKQQRCHL